MHPGHEIGEVFLYREAIDFRKSIDGLSAIVEMELGKNIFFGSLFVFTNRRRDKMKILYWDKTGFCLWYKRLEEDIFPWMKGPRGLSSTISGEQLKWLIEGVNIWDIRPHKTLKYISNG